MCHWDQCYEAFCKIPLGAIVNLTDLGRDHELRTKQDIFPGNAGQVIRKFLEEEKGVNLDHYRILGDGRYVRKAKKRFSGSKITIPTEESSLDLKKRLTQLILDGVYTLGESIVPQTYECLYLDGEKIKVKSYEVSGRKFSIEYVKDKMFKNQKHLLRLKPDSFYENITEETLASELARIGENCDVEKLKYYQRHRTIACWHDTSGITNASHFLVLFATIYDPAIFYTDEEFFEIAGYRANVQAMVEKPVPYILARCPANALQLCYGDVRLEDYIKINTKLYEVTPQIKIQDEIRFFKGDAPASQLEAGQQKGGNFPCWHCPIKMTRGRDLAYVLNCERQSLQDRIDKLKSTNYGQNAIINHVVNPSDKISKPEIVGVLHELGADFRDGEKKADLKAKFDNEMIGIHHVPAVLYNSAQTDMSKTGLESYEILPVEPLHTIAGHIKNLYQEIPAHLSPCIIFGRHDSENQKDYGTKAVWAVFSCLD